MCPLNGKGVLSRPRWATVPGIVPYESSRPGDGLQPRCIPVWMNGCRDYGYHLILTHDTAKNEEKGVKGIMRNWNLTVINHIYGDQAEPFNLPCF